MAKIKATRLFTPYTAAGRCALKNTGKGIYYILHNNKIVYIGKSNTNLKTTLYRHFQQWNDKRTVAGRQYTNYERVTYYGYPTTQFKCKVLFLTSDELIDKLETALIMKHKPRDNVRKLMMYKESELLNALLKVNAANLQYVPVNDNEENYF